MVSLSLQDLKFELKKRFLDEEGIRSSRWKALQKDLEDFRLMKIEKEIKPKEERDKEANQERFQGVLDVQHGSHNPLGRPT